MPKQKYNTKKRRLQHKRNKRLVLVSMLFVGIVSTLSPNIALSPEKRNNFLPTNHNKEMTMAEEVYKEARTACSKRGLGQFCIKDLQGIAWTETKFKCNAVGDFGSSHGCFQIHQGYHHEVSQEQAEDVKFAVNWTLDRLQKYGYPEYRSHAIRKHNGSPTNPKTLTYLNKVNNF